MKGIVAWGLGLVLALTAALAQEEAPAPPASAASPVVAPPEIAPASAAASATPATPAGEQPSAELIIDAEETATKEPGLPAGEEPLPQVENLPGEENIFGDDLFGPGEFYQPAMPEMPSVPPVIEDPREAERKLRVKFRKVTARLAGDPELVALQEMADRAPTPEDYRAARRSYYALLYGKVCKADISLKDYADRLEKASVANLYQTKIEPTVALNPPPEPQPQAKFIPPNEFPEVLPADEEPVALP